VHVLVEKWVEQWVKE
jgi:hypothetical protein